MAHLIALNVRITALKALVRKAQLTTRQKKKAQLTPSAFFF